MADVSPTSNSTYESELKVFKEKREASARSWTKLAGLFWLKEGIQTFGSDPKNDHVLPAKAPAHLGQIRCEGKKCEVSFLVTKDVKLNGKPVEAGKFYVLSSDTDKDPSEIQWQDIQIFLIDRARGLGLRVIDEENPVGKQLESLQWWPAQEKYKLEARWVKLPQEREMEYPDVTGETHKAKITGYIEFEWEGKTLRLYPNERSEDRAMIMFKDSTNGPESYGAGRWVTVHFKDENTVLIDFNRSYNPPCAYTKYATCPLPPPENTLKIAIRAGEKKPTVKSNSKGES